MMNGLVRSALRVTALKNVITPAVNVTKTNVQINRMLWNMCNRLEHNSSNLVREVNKSHSELCNCGGCRAAHTKAEKELVEFLAEEIVAEKKARKLKTIPTDLEGFKVSLDGAEVRLVKKDAAETITISFNINHTITSEEEPEIDPQDDKADVGEMRSKPNFDIDIVRGSQTLSFTCSFNSEPGASGADESYNDIFGIDEITLFEGEYSDKVYAVSGEVIDGYLYDLLMNYLEEKGISNEFTEKMMELSTSYEHTAYISLLEGLSKFTTSK